MGWFALAIIYPLYLAIDVNALYWLLAGGIFYSLGTVFYSAKNTQFSQPFGTYLLLPAAFVTMQVLVVMCIEGKASSDKADKIVNKVYFIYLLN